MDELDKIRQNINEIDEKMASLFEQRMHAAEQVAAYKTKHSLPILDKTREKALIERNTAFIQNETYIPYYEEFLTGLMALSRAYQRACIAGDTVAFQGAEGAFSHIALRGIFPGAKELAANTFGEVFSLLEAGEAAYGVIPFENSFAGEVGEVFDLLFSHNLYICDMYDLPVWQNLLGVVDGTIEDIREVYTHPQAIEQCRAFLNEHKFKTVVYPNTAMAAKYVRECNDPSKAAIASAQTADIYGLKVIRDNINTNPENTTRFIVLCKEEPREGSHFCLLFTLGHDAGALARVVQLIAEFGFSMESIKSRPVKNVPWKYYFYVEIEGDAKGEKAEEMFLALSKECTELRFLGSFNREEGK